MTRFMALKRIEDEKLFSDLIVGFVKKHKTPEAVAEALNTELEVDLKDTVEEALQNYSAPV